MAGSDFLSLNFFVPGDAASTSAQHDRQLKDRLGSEVTRQCVGHRKKYGHYGLSCSGCIIGRIGLDAKSRR